MFALLLLAATAVADEPPENGEPSVVAVGSLVGWHCSGVAVDATHVLTARHCLPVTRVGQGPDVRQLVEVDVAAVGFAPGGRDVVLLTLSDALIEVKGVVPAKVTEDAGLIAWGFGRQRLEDGRFRLGRRHAIDLSYGTLSTCDSYLAPIVGCRRGELVIQGPGTIDTCNGDSGGPLLQQVEGRWEWIGVVSRAVGSASLRCGDGGVYVAASGLTDWLRIEIEED